MANAIPAEVSRPAEASITSWCSGHNASANACSSGVSDAGAATEGSCATTATAVVRDGPDVLSRCSETATMTSNATAAPDSINNALRENADGTVRTLSPQLKLK